MFRASPWITYTPSAEEQDTTYTTHLLVSNNNMDEDMDMDAPQISTLRDEESPPPQTSPTRTSKFRVKLLVNQQKNSSPHGAGKQTSSLQVENDGEDEDEEDQLIDDDDDIDTRPPPAIAVTAAPAVPSLAPKRKPLPAKKPRQRKNDKSEKVEPETRLFEEKPLLQAEPHEYEELNVGDNWDTQSNSNANAPESSSQKPLPKKKAASSRKSLAVPSRQKLKVPLKTFKSLPIPNIDDGGTISDTYTGTAASTPAPPDANTPEPDPALPPASTEEVNLENIPVPVYPLPTKPFPVQLPPKIPSGFAPVIPLDRSGTKVRRWRTANREIRGIAGGRWFARSWVGDKESEFCTAAAAASEAILKGAQTEGDKQSSGLLPKPSGLSASGSPSAKGAGKGKSSRGQTSATPSRSGSIIQEHHSARAPTKMRTAVTASAPSAMTSEAGVDSDTPQVNVDG